MTLLNTYPNEDPLVTRAVNGDAEAFGELYRLHHDAILRFIAVRVGDKTEAEDLTEQVFLKAWEALPNYQQRGPRFASWLYQIARNLVIDHHRAQKPGQQAKLDDHSDYESNQATALEQVLEAEQSAALATAVSRLPHEQRQVIFLRFIRGMDHAEVARVLQKSKGATRVIQHRALAALNQMLGNTFLVLLILVLLLGGSTVYAADGSLPGDTLYPVKRASESVEYAVAFNPANTAHLHLRLATRRLNEAQRLAETDRTAALGSTLAEYTSELAVVRGFLQQDTRLNDQEQRTLASLLLASEAVQRDQIATIRQRVPANLLANVELANDARQAALDRALTTSGQGPLPLVLPTATPSATTVPSNTPGATPSQTPSTTPRPSVTPSATSTSTPSSTPSATSTPSALPTNTAVPRPRATRPAIIPTNLPAPVVPTSQPDQPVATPTTGDPQQPTAWPRPENWPPDMPWPPERPADWPPDMPWPPERPADLPRPTAPGATEAPAATPTDEDDSDDGDDGAGDGGAPWPTPDLTLLQTPRPTREVLPERTPRPTRESRPRRP